MTGPVVLPSALAATATANVLAAELPHALEALTDIIPAVVPQFTIAVLVPWPETMVTPVGTNHLYVRPVTVVTE